VPETRKRFDIEQEFCKYESQSYKFQLKPRGKNFQLLHCWFVSYSFSFLHARLRLQGFTFTLNGKAILYSTLNDSENGTFTSLFKAWSRSNYHMVRYMTMHESKNNLKHSSLTLQSIDLIIKFSHIVTLDLYCLFYIVDFLKHRNDFNILPNLYVNSYDAQSLKKPLAVALAVTSHFISDIATLDYFVTVTSNYLDKNDVLLRYTIRYAQNNLTNVRSKSLYSFYSLHTHLKIQLKGKSDVEKPVLCLSVKNDYYDYRQVISENKKTEQNSSNSRNSSNACEIVKGVELVLTKKLL
jgi:hypothetical protein